jgi:tRNA pseudouridine(55) synthase
VKNIFKKILLINKKEGETPLQALDKFREKNLKYKNIKMTYAGRLDPMASGLLLVIIGDEIKNKEKYLALDKEYKFEVLFGFATDTYDILGKIISCIKKDMTRKELKEMIEKSLKHFSGEFAQKYPMYSSKTVKGKQLFKYARNGVDVEAPSRKVFVKELKLLGLKKIKQESLLKNIEKRIGKVKGDFRQEEILRIWHKHLEAEPVIFYVARFIIKCGSGTYVRGIADSLGDRIGIPSLAFSIKRTKIYLTK